ncbi:hypothetical protein [Streptomyces sp. MMG1121]|uniref:hypothetical protein n=1 Tax=Streptomyces sp. MMG1121 TaxID=1415544 RepID=UPI0006AE44BA|nr:hypothetical protein [Streptomyces sp. MMG1121]KOV58724.1 hypothetical protein ADK64_35710 [Streptomyces sp. MMG1121]
MLKLRKAARRVIAVTAAAMAFAGSTAITAGTAHAATDTCYYRQAVNVAGVDLKPGICITGNQSASSVDMVGGASQTPSGAHIVFTMNKVVNGQAIPQFSSHVGGCDSHCSWSPWSGAVQPGNYYNVSMSWIDGSGVWHGNIQSPTYWLS